MSQVLVKRLAVLHCTDRDDTTGRLPHRELYRLEEQYSENHTQFLSNRWTKDPLDSGRNVEEQFCNSCYGTIDCTRSMVKTPNEILKFIY